MGLSKGVTFPQKVGQDDLSIVAWGPPDTAMCYEKGKSWEHLEVVLMRLGVLWAPPLG